METQEAARRIKTIGSSYIKTPAIKVKKWQSLDRVLSDMLEIGRSLNAAGLAANQIGVKSRIVLLRINGEGFIINPEIVERSTETKLDWEGCLSIPGYRAQVERYEGVVVKGFDPNWRPIKIRASGLLARAIQHECDHCSGLLYVDRPHIEFTNTPFAEESDEDNA